MNPKLRLWLGNALLACATGLAVAYWYPRLTKETEEPEKVVVTGYDSILAQKFGADEYGMRSYVIAFLKAGPNRNQNPEEAQELQRQHLDNISRMAEDGTLVLAGPFMDDHEVRGIYVFAVSDTSEARKLTETDPAIKAGRLIMELRPWYGSAALVGVNEVHERIAKENP